MAVLTDAQLTTEANVIKNEVSAGANTASRVGQMVIDLIDSKPNVAAVIRTVKVTLSSAQILALNGTPITLVAAQGAGTMIRPVQILINKTFVSVAYATNIDLALGSGTVFASTFGNALGFSASEVAVYPVASNASASPATGSINIDLKISVPVGNPTAGNGTLAIYLTYNVITL